MAKKIKVLISDDHRLVRHVIRKMLEQEEDIMVVGEAPDGIETIKLAKETSPDVILMDLNMPKMNGIEATNNITAASKNHVRIIGLSLHDDEAVKRSMLTAGAVAYHSKSDGLRSLCETIRRHRQEGE